MTKEVATVGATPSYLQKLESQGPVNNQTNFDSSDVEIPRIKLLSATSDEVKSHDQAQAGMFWHTGLDESLGESIKFTVILAKKKVLLVAPMDDGQGVLARAEDARTWDKMGEWDVCLDKKNKINTKWAINDLSVEKSGLLNWGTYNDNNEDSPPAATLFYEYVVALADRPELGLAVISLARTAIKRAKKGLNDKIELHAGNGRPMQSIIFSAKVTEEVNDVGQDYYGYTFTGAGFVQDEDTFNKYMSMADNLGEYKVQDEASAADDGKGGGQDENAHKDAKF